MKEWNRLDTCRMLAGAISGASAQFVGHPIDTIKVRIQQSKIKTTIFHTTKNIVLNEGFRSFYRGVVWPTIMRLFVQSSFYCLNGYLREWEEDRVRHENNISDECDIVLPLWKVGLIAGFSGFLLFPLLGPIELIKIQLQKNSTQYKKPMDVVRMIRKRGYNQFTRGCLATDMVLGKNSFGIRAFIGSGLAGMVAWITSIGPDYIKTQIQAQPIGSKHLLIREVVRITYKKYGMKGFYIGLAPALVRSVPVNITNLLVYEFAFQKFKLFSDYLRIEDKNNTFVQV